MAGTKRKPVEPTDDRVLPHSLDAERAVLGGVLLNNQAYFDAAWLPPEAFYRRAHQAVWGAMGRLMNRASGAIDVLLLSEELQRGGVALEKVGGPMYLGALTDGVTRATNVSHYAAIVGARARARLAIVTMSKTIGAAYDTGQDIDEVIATADREIVSLRHGLTRTAQTFADRTSAVLADLEARVQRRGQLSGIDTGWAATNDLTDGWQRGDLIVVAARPSMGKTALVTGAMQRAAEALTADSQRRFVQMFSLEMRREQVEHRVLANLSGVPLLRLQRGLLGHAASDDWTRLHEAIERFHNMDIAIDDSGGMTHQDIRAVCRRQQATGRLDLVVIDYVQLMRGSIAKRNATRTEELADISRSLKVMAGELGVPVILLSQLRRTGGGKPKLEDLRESGALEQDADIVMFIHRKRHTDEGLTELIVEKNRNGPTGTAHLNFVREIVRFDPYVEVPQEQIDAAAQEDAADEARANRARHAKRRKSVTI